MFVSCQNVREVFSSSFSFLFFFFPFHGKYVIFIYLYLLLFALSLSINIYKRYIFTKYGVYVKLKTEILGIVESTRMQTMSFR